MEFRPKPQEIDECIGCSELITPDIPLNKALRHLFHTFGVRRGIARLIRVAFRRT